MKRTEVLLSTLFLISFLVSTAPQVLGQCTPSLTIDPNNTLCSGSSLQMTATVNLPTGCVLNGGSPFLWSGPGTPFSTSSNTLSLGFASAGSYSVSVNIADNGSGTCPCTFGAFGTATVGPSNIITVNPTGSAPSIPFLAGVCEGESVTVTAAYGGFTTGQFEWYSNAALTNLEYTGNPFVSSPLNFSRVFFVREVTTNGCPGPISSTFQGVNANPTAPAATGDVICPGTDATLTATAAGGTTINWYDSPVAGTLLGTGGSFNTGTLFQTTIFYVEAVSNANGCTSGRTSVQVFVLPQLARPVAPDIFICEGELAEIVAIASGTAGNSFLWYDIAVGGTPIQVSPMPTSPASPNDTLIVGPFLAGSVIFYVSELDVTTGCETQRSPVTVFVTDAVPQPQADDEEICEGDSVTLRADYGIGSNQGNFYWWTDSINGSLLQIGQNYTPPASLVGTPGTYDFWVEEQFGGCESPTRDRVTITVFPKPGFPTIISDTICAGANGSMFAFSSTPGFIVEWYTDGAVQNIISFGPFFFTPALNQNTTYYLRERNPLTGCVGDIIPVTVFVFSNPPAPGTSNIIVCENEDAVITATSSGAFFARLDLYSAAGALIQSSTRGATSFNFNLGQLGQGTYTYFIEETETISGCVSPRTSMTVTVNSIPANPTTSGVSICEGSTATLSASFGGPTTGTFSWYSDASLTNLLTTGNTYTTPVLTANTTYFVTESTNNCEGLATSALVTVDPVPAGPTASNDTICAGGTAVFTATASAGGILNWYDNAAGNTVLATGGSYTTTSLNQSTTFYVQEVIVGNACSSPIVAVNAVVNPLPTAPTVNNFTVCSNEDAIILTTGSGTANSRIDLYDNTNTLVQSGTQGQANASFNLGNQSAGTYTYYVVEVDVTSSCQSAQSAVSFTSTNPPAIPSVPVASICEGETATLTATSGGGTNGSFNWYSDASLTTLVSTGGVFVTPTLTANTTYYITETASGCEGSEFTVIITVNANPADPTGSGVTICEGETATITASGTAGNQLNWYDNAAGNTVIGTGPSFTTTTLTQNTTYWVQEVAVGTGCLSNLAPVTVTVNPLPAAPSANDVTFCASDPVVIAASGSGNANSRIDLYDQATGGTAVQTGTQGSAAASFNLGQLPVGASVYYVEEVDVVTGCVSARTAVNTTVDTNPVAPAVSGTLAVCDGDGTTLTATSGGGTSGTFNWYADAMLSNLLASGSSYSTGNLTVSTSYFVTEVIGGCESPSTTVTIIVNALPADPVGTGATICEGETATITATGNASNQLNWYDNAAGNTVIGTGPSFTTTALTQNTTYWVQEIAVGSGCISNLVPVTVTVNPLPAAPSANDVTFCASDPVVIAASGSGNANSRIDLYDQATGGTAVQTGTQGSAAASFNLGQLPVGASVYYVEEVDVVTGCVSARTAVNTTVDTNPVAPAVSGTLAVCDGDGTTLTATSGGGTSGTFNWYADAALSNLLASGSSYSTGNLNATTSYFVTEAVGSCESPSTTVTVTVNPLAAAPTTTADTVCSGQSASLTAIGLAGNTITWYADAAGNNLLFTGPILVTVPLTQTTTFYVEQTTTGSGCTSGLVAVTAVVNPNPATPSSSDITFCESENVIISASGSGGTNSRLDLFNQATGGAAVQTGTIGNASESFNLGQLPVGTSVYYVEETDVSTGCTSARIAVNVTVDEDPSAPTVTGTTSICDGDASRLTAASGGGTSGSFNWYADAALSNLLATGSSYTTGSLNGSTTYYVTENVGSCESPSTSVTVTVNALAAAPTTTADTVCSGESASLTATGVAGNTLNWYADAAGNNLLFSGNTLVTVSLTQTTTFYVEQITTGTGCASGLVAVTAVVNPLPAAPTAADLNICITDPAVIVAAGSGDPSTRVDLYTVATGGLALQTGTGSGSQSFTLGLLGPGTSVYYIVETNLTTGCASSRTAVTITVSPAPVNPTISGNATLCEGESTTLTAASGGGTAGTFNWYADAALTNFLATGSSYATGTLNANATYYVTETVGGCESTPTQIVVTVNAPPVDPTLAADTVCAGQAATLVATGTAGNQINWYDNASANTVIFTGVSFTTSALTQNTTYWVQEVGVGTGCVSNVVPVSAVVNPTPATPSTSDVTFCASDQVVISASGTGNANTRLDLYDLPTGGAVVQNGSVATATTTFNLGILPVGTYVYYIEEVDITTGCVSGRVSVNVSVDAAPSTPTLSGNTTICAGDFSVLTATSSGSTTGNFNWYADVALTNLLLTGSSFNTGAISATTTYYATENVGNCESPAASITVTVNALAAAPTVTPDTVCAGQSASLTATGAAGNTINWYTDPAGNNLLFTGPTLVTVALTQTTTFYVEQVTTGTGCSSSLVAVTAVVNPVPNAPTAANPNICVTDPAVIVAAGSGNPSTRIDLYNVATGGLATQTGTSSGSQSFNLGLLGPGIFIYYLEEVDIITGCSSSRTAVIVTVSPAPANPNVTGNRTLCAGESTTLTAASTGGTAGTFNWYADAALTNFLTGGSSYATGTLNASVTYYVTETVGGCESTPTQVLITVNQPPADPVLTADTVCTGQSATLVATGTAGNQLNWYDNASANTVVFTGNTFTTAALTQNTTYWVQEVAVGTGCVSNVVSVVAVVNPIPPTPSTSDVTFCATDQAVISASGTGNANTRLDLYALPTGGAVVQNGPAGSAVTSFNLGVLPVGTYVYFIEEVDITTGCVSSRVSVNVTVDPVPSLPTVSGNTTLCSGDFSILTATSGGGTSGTFNWYGDAALTNLLATGSSYTTAALTANTTLYVTEAVGNCESGAASISITVNPLPAAPMVTGDTICEGSSATLSAAATAGNTLNWYADANRTTLLFTGQTFVTPPLTQTITYWVEQVVIGTGCASPLSAVSVVVNSAPPSPSANNVNACTNQSVDLTVSGTGDPNTRIDLYVLASGGLPVQTGIGGTATEIFTLGLLGPGTFVYYVEEINLTTGCASPRTSVTITVDPIPANPVVSGAITCVGQSATLTATSGSGGTGGTFNWYSDAALTTLVFTGNPYNSPPLSGTTTYYVTEKVGACESGATQVVVVVNPMPTDPVVTGDTICVGLRATLTATGVAGGTLNWYDNASGTSSIAVGPSFTTPVLSQTTTYWVQQTTVGTGCESNLVPVTAVVNPAPVAPSAAAVTACASEDVIITASASANANTRVNLYDVATGGTVIQNGPLATTPISFNIGMLAVGSYTYYVEEEDVSSGCISPRVAVTITVVPAPANPNIAGILTLCEGESTTLTASSSTGTTGSFSWYADSALTNLLFTGSSLTVTPTVSTVYWVAELVGSCQSVAAKATVTVNPKPNNPIVISATVCSGQSANLIAAGTPGNNINWYNNASANTLLFTGNVFASPALTQTTTFWVNQQDPTTGCESDLVPVNVTVLPLPSPPSASDITICEGTVGRLTATGSGTGSLRWYNAPGALTPVRIDGMPPATANFSVGPFAPGTFVFYVDEYDGTCASTRTAMNVNVLPVPNAPIVAPITVCEGQSATLTANFGGATRGDFRWYDATGTTLLFVGGTFTSSALTVTTTFIVTEKDSICESDPTTIIVTVDPTPASPIVVPDTVCQGQPATLAAAGAAGNFLNWYSDPNALNLVFTGGLYTTPTLNQTTTFYVRQVIVGTGCESPLTPVTAVVNTLPPAPTATTVYVCEGDLGVITASGTGNANTVLNWYDDPAFILPIQVNTMPPSSSTLQVGPFVPGTYTYYIEEENTVTGCKSTRSAVSIVVTPRPAQPSINDTSICEGNSVTINAPGTGTFRWYDAPTGGNLIHVGLSYTTPVLTQTTIYYVSLDVNGCESLRETVVITVNGLPSTPTIGSNAPICEGDTLFLTSTFVSNVVYSWSGPNGFTSNDQNPTITNVTQGFNQGVYSLTLTDIGTGCPSMVTSLLVIINPRPATPTVQSNSPVCAGEDLTLTVGAVPGATYNWTGPGGFISTTNQPILVINNTTSADSGQYQVTVSLNGCESQAGITNVLVDPVPNAPTADNDGPHCVGDDLQLTAFGGLGGQYSWTGPNNFSSNLQNPLISNVLLTDAGTYEVRYISATGCLSPVAGATTVTINPPPPAILIFANTPISEGDTLEFFAPFVPNAIYSWSGPAGFTSSEQNPRIPNVNEADNQGDYTLVITDTTTGCSSEPITLYIDIEPGIGSISIFVDNDGPACPGDTVNLMVSIIPGAIYSWTGPDGFQSNDQNPRIINTQAVNAGVYTVNVTLPNGLSGSGTTTVSVGNGLDVDAGPDVLIQIGQDAQLSVTGGVTWQWFPVNFLSFPNISNPIVQNPPLGEFTYWVDAIGLDGCIGSDTVKVTVVEQLPPVTPDELVVYDLFTPNGDGINDTWVVDGIQRLQDYQLSVFNRGGAVVYSTTNYQNDWTGTYRGQELPEGTYWYIITVGEDVIKGPITIIR